MSYRIELAKTNRSGCQATHCKKEGTKIEKGELRQGTLVTIQEHTSMKWRHWGCVTPQVLKNWRDSSDMDMELIDGYEDLPAAAQEKVKRALEQGHVDDEDWNGDVEMNRLTDKKNQGMFKKTPKKKAKDDSDDEAEEASPTKQPAKKRGRAKQEEDEDEVEPAPKKAKGKTKKAAPADEHPEPEQAPPAKKSKKSKKAAEEATDDAEPKAAAPAKKGRGKKAKSAETVEVDDEMPSPVEEAPPKKASKTKKGTAKPAAATNGDEDAPKSKPQKRRGKKASAVEED